MEPHLTALIRDQSVEKRKPSQEGVGGLKLAGPDDTVVFLALITPGLVVSGNRPSGGPAPRGLFREPQLPQPVLAGSSRPAPRAQPALRLFPELGAHRLGLPLG